ncbi:hypothetical protein NUW58_g3909 [Xylaria curta]|uniref:Uncharacterized protein n=1 Tax=Xylaria curta TaxID=42375 RepID=A0ACC1P983_9PEZI|nr:hypothetical protein NUW58_g3909 [Xylaria curta]
MPRLWSIIRQKPVRASARTSLGASATLPTSGTTSIDNSEGASQAVAELLDGLDIALAQIDFEDDPRVQLTAQLEQLNRKANNYANSSLDFCSSKAPWICTSEMTHLIMKAWICAETVYESDLTSSSEELEAGGLKIEWALASSANGDVKATTLTTFDDGFTNYLIIAVRGSASTVDHLVNLHGEPRDASTLYPNIEKAPNAEDQTPSFLAHAGFLNSAKALLEPVSAQIEKRIGEGQKFNIIFTGHSAGGAVATLLHLALRVKFAGNSFSCITFGSPPVAKIVSQEDEIALNRIVAEAPVLNIINEYDLVSRLDSAYVRSLIQLYNSGAPDFAKGESFTTEEIPEKCWPLPTRDLQHIGSIVVLKTELPDLKLDETKPSDVSTRVTAWSVTPESMSSLVFCQIQVHRRKYYRQKIEQLTKGGFESVVSSKRSSDTLVTCESQFSAN